MHGQKIIVGIVIMALILVGVMTIKFLLWAPTPNHTVITVMGQTLELKPVSGEDVPCIGSPPGYMRCFYEKEGSTIDVIYYAEGDDSANLENWLTRQASACGYEVVDHGNANVPGACIMHYGFTNDSTGDTLNTNLGTVKASDGKTYTVIEMLYEPGGNTPNEGGGFTEGKTEVTPPPTMRWLHEAMKEILTRIFGNAVLYEYGGPITVNGGMSFTLKYIVDRSIEANDLEKLASALRNENWQILQASNDGGALGIVAMKGNQELAISMGVGGNGVDVEYMQVNKE